MTRRELHRAAALAAAGAALPGDAATPALRWGIIGTGSRCRHHIAALKSLPEMRIAAACDVDPGRLRSGLQRIGGSVPGFSDHQELLAGAEVDAVLICTPNLLHRSMTLDALKAGKHVLCEKPMATTLEDCLAMKKAAAGAGRVLLFGLQLRYTGRFRSLQSLVQTGKVGAPRYLSLQEFRGDWNSGDVWRFRDPRSGREMNWRYSQTASGGTLNEKCCHYFDILNWLAGRFPKRVSCSGGLIHYRERETWDHATIHLEYEGGLRASHSLCLFGPHRLDLQVIGDEGSLHLMSDHILFEKKGARTGEKIPLPPEVDHGERGPAGVVESAVLRMYQEFQECVRTGGRPVVDADTAIASSKIAFLAEKSAALRREVSWEG